MKKLILFMTFLLFVVLIQTSFASAKGARKRWSDRTPANLIIPNITDYDFAYKCGHKIYYNPKRSRRYRKYSRVSKSKALARNEKSKTRKSKGFSKKTFKSAEADTVKSTKKRRYARKRRKKSCKCDWKMYYSDYYIDDAKAYRENVTYGRDYINWIYKKDR